MWAETAVPMRHYIGKTIQPTELAQQRCTALGVEARDEIEHRLGAMTFLGP